MPTEPDPDNPSDFANYVDPEGDLEEQLPPMPHLATTAADVEPLEQKRIA